MKTFKHVIHNNSNPMHGNVHTLVIAVGDVAFKIQPLKNSNGITITKMAENIGDDNIMISAQAPNKIRII